MKKAKKLHAEGYDIQEIALGLNRTGNTVRRMIHEYYMSQLEELIKGGTERLKELMDYRKMEMDVQDLEAQIGDTIAGRDYDTGFYLQKPITGKIVRVQEGEISVEYKVKGED